jgi:hypothetical protein
MPVRVYGILSGDEPGWVVLEPAESGLVSRLIDQGGRAHLLAAHATPEAAWVEFRRVYGAAFDGWWRIPNGVNPIRYALSHEVSHRARYHLGTEGKPGWCDKVSVSRR